MKAGRKRVRRYPSLSGHHDSKGGVKMRNSLLINDFPDTFSQLLLEERHSDAINLIFNIAHQVVGSGKFKGHVNRLPELDAAISQLAALMREDGDCPSLVEDVHVCIATEIYNTGGHGQAMNAVCNEIDSHIIFSDLFGQIVSGVKKLDNIVTPKALSSITVNSGTLLHKVRSLVNLLKAIKPKHVWLFNHHQDVVIVLAALLFDQGRRTIFVHHCDHDPGLGATIRFPHHLDFTSELMENCGSIGLNTSPISLYTKPPGGKAISIGSGLTVATAGRVNKFTGSMGGIEYRELVKEVLSHPSVSAFHHIGSVEQSYVADLKSYLGNTGVNPDRLKFAGEVPDISDFLISSGVNLYWSSFPLAAGSTTAEAQGAGIPVAFFDQSLNTELPLCAVESIYASPDLKWSCLEDIPRVLETARNDWKRLSEAATRKYEECFSREAFCNHLAGFR